MVEETTTVVTKIKQNKTRETVSSQHKDDRRTEGKKEREDKRSWEQKKRGKRKEGKEGRNLGNKGVRED